MRNSGCGVVVYKVITSEIAALRSWRSEPHRHRAVEPLFHPSPAIPQPELVSASNWSMFFTACAVRSAFLESRFARGVRLPTRQEPSSHGFNRAAEIVLSDRHGSLQLVAQPVRTFVRYFQNGQHVRLGGNLLLCGSPPITSENRAILGHTRPACRGRGEGFRNRSHQNAFDRVGIRGRRRAGRKDVRTRLVDNGSGPLLSASLAARRRKAHAPLMRIEPEKGTDR